MRTYIVIYSNELSLGFLAADLVLLGPLFVGLLSSSASYVAAIDLLMSGKYAAVFWMGVIAAGMLLSLVLGGFALRWVLVGEGQASHVIAVIGI